MRSVATLALGVLIVASACSSASPAAPTETTITLTGSDVTYQRAPTTVTIMPLSAGLKAQNMRTGTVSVSLKAVGNGTFILAAPITLDLNTDYWLYVTDTPTVCCWEAGNKDSEVTVLGKRLTRFGYHSNSLDNSFASYVKFVTISREPSLTGVRTSVQ